MRTVLFVFYLPPKEFVEALTPPHMLGSHLLVFIPRSSVDISFLFLSDH